MSAVCKKLLSNAWRPITDLLKEHFFMLSKKTEFGLMVGGVLKASHSPSIWCFNHSLEDGRSNTVFLFRDISSLPAICIQCGGEFLVRYHKQCKYLTKLISTPTKGLIYIEKCINICIAKTTPRHDFLAQNDYKELMFLHK